jgi:Flp pilus assembly pilin Flp
MLRRWLREEDGQDVLEYALLAAVIGIAAILVWQGIVTQLGGAYTGADADVQTRSACTPDPGGGGC